MIRTLILPGVALIREFMSPEFGTSLVSAVREATSNHPPIHFRLRSRAFMPVAMTNMGQYGWYSDPDKGPTYTTLCPWTNTPWPEIPNDILGLSEYLLSVAPYSGEFKPQSCLVSLFKTGDFLPPHEDRDERDKTKPIIHVSFGSPGVFSIFPKGRPEERHTFNLNEGSALVIMPPNRNATYGISTILSNGGPSAMGVQANTHLNLTIRQAF